MLLDLPPMPNPMRYAELSAAFEWHIPLDEWDRKTALVKMEMMAYVDAKRKYESYVKWQQDKYWRAKRAADKPKPTRMRSGR